MGSSPSSTGKSRTHTRLNERLNETSVLTSLCSYISPNQQQQWICQKQSTRWTFNRSRNWRGLTHRFCSGLQSLGVCLYQWVFISHFHLSLMSRPFIFLIPLLIPNYTDHKLIVCDLQGVLDLEGFNPVFRLTDPAICSKGKKDRYGGNSNKYRYGKTDLGMRGIRSFCCNHICNDVCKALSLPAMRNGHKLARWMSRTSPQVLLSRLQSKCLTLMSDGRWSQHIITGRCK